MVALKREGLQGGQAEKIEARVNPFVLQATGPIIPEMGLAGKLRRYHCAAVALLDGTARELYCGRYFMSLFVSIIYLDSTYFVG